jgi:hypothetical protein
MEALVALTVGVVRARHRWQDVRPALRLRCEEFVDGTNAADTSLQKEQQTEGDPPWQHILLVQR